MATVGGPDRPPSKKMIEQSQANAAQARSQARGNNAAGSSSAEDQGYWAYMQRQVQERTERLNILGDSVNKLEDASSSWATEASKYVQKTKKNIVMGAVKGKFGL
jgi:syntaxin-binding protein 5